MSLQDFLEIAKGFPREEKVLLIEALGSQVADEFTSTEVEDIRRCLDEADSEIERGQILSAESFFKKLER